MKRTYRFVLPHGVVHCEVSGWSLDLLVFMGVLKHPTEDQVAHLLTNPVNVRKYTAEALRRLPWSALRLFPRAWLVHCQNDVTLPEGRRRALEHMLLP